MKLQPFNTEVLEKIYPDTNSQLEKYLKDIEKSFSTNENISIIFVEEEYIRELNKEYRKIDNTTDVLSFNLENDDINGEIYICPAYISESEQNKSHSEEVWRLIIHGILHIQGYDHERELNNEEEMFVKQEKILQNILKK